MVSGIYTGSSGCFMLQIFVSSGHIYNRLVSRYGEGETPKRTYIYTDGVV